MKRFAEIIFIGLLVFALLILASELYSWFFGRSSRTLPIASYGGSRVGLVEVEGVILDSKPVVKLIADYRKDSSIRGILVRIDSPGGGVVASHEIYDALKRASEAGLPVVASMSTVAASGGYYIACAADTIVANPGTTTGSIGVIISLIDYSGLLGKIGIKFNNIKSGKFKDIGDGSRPLTPAEREVLQNYIDDAYGQFVDIVAEARQIERQQVLAIADGRIYTGQQAQNLGLVDVLGTYDDALTILGELAGLRGKPDVVKPRKKRVTLFDLLFGDVTEELLLLNKLPMLRYQLVL